MKRHSQTIANNRSIPHIDDRKYSAVVRSWRVILATAAGVAALTLPGFVPAQADDRVTASITAYHASRDKYEVARQVYVTKRQQTLTEWRVVSALYTVANVNLTQAKRNIRDQFRRDVAAADKTYRAALKIARTAAARTAAFDEWNAAKAQAAVSRDADMNSLRDLTAPPSRPGR